MKLFEVVDLSRQVNLKLIKKSRKVALFDFVTEQKSNYKIIIELLHDEPIIVGIDFLKEVNGVYTTKLTGSSDISDTLELSVALSKAYVASGFKPDIIKISLEDNVEKRKKFYTRLLKRLGATNISDCIDTEGNHAMFVLLNKNVDTSDFDFMIASKNGISESMSSSNFNLEKKYCSYGKGASYALTTHESEYLVSISKPITANENIYEISFAKKVNGKYTIQLQKDSSIAEVANVFNGILRIIDDCVRTLKPIALYAELTDNVDKRKIFYTRIFEKYGISDVYLASDPESNNLCLVGNLTNQPVKYFK